MLEVLLCASYTVLKAACLETHVGPSIRGPEAGFKLFFRPCFSHFSC